MFHCYLKLYTLVSDEDSVTKLMTMNNQARLLQNSERERCGPVADYDIVNSRSDVQPDEIHSLRDSIRRLLTDNEELCDLCCFLDDDRQRYRRDVAEWQKLHHRMATEITKKVLRVFCCVRLCYWPYSQVNF